MARTMTIIGWILLGGGAFSIGYFGDNTVTIAFLAYMLGLAMIRHTL